MKILIAALLSAGLIALVPNGQKAPAHISNVDSVQKVQPVQTRLPENKPQAIAEEKVQTEQESIVQPEQAEVATPEPVVVETPQTPVIYNDAKAFIYEHESGNIPWKRNSIGCYGLGQDCNGIVEARCGADYSCQDEFFTDYMLQRYGSWEAARSFWLARVPINGKDVGNWW